MLKIDALPENIQLIEEEKSIKGLKRITFTLEGRPYQLSLSEKEIDIPNLQFGTSDNLEDLKNDKYLLKRLSHLDWNEVLRPVTSQIQYRLWKENHS